MKRQWDGEREREERNDHLSLVILCGCKHHLLRLSIWRERESLENRRISSLFRQRARVQISGRQRKEKGAGESESRGCGSVSDGKAMRTGNICFPTSGHHYSPPKCLFGFLFLFSYSQSIVWHSLAQTDRAESTFGGSTLCIQSSRLKCSVTQVLCIP